MFNPLRSPLRWLAFLCAFIALTSAQVVVAPAPAQISLSPGVVYRHVQRHTVSGEPWSIHVLELNRNQRSLELRAVAAAGESGEMQRELPSAMGARLAQPGKRVLAVVNGDYDLQKDYPGVSDGLAITSGHLWTSAHTGRSVFAISRTGEPIIAVPELTVELRARRRTWPIAGVNKPLGVPFGTWPRLYTREFRAQLPSDSPLRCVIIGELSPSAALPSEGSIHGKVVQIIDSATRATIPNDSLVVAEPAAESAGLNSLHAGDVVNLRVRTRVAGHKVQHVIGGFPVLVRSGRKSIEGNPGESLSKRHPRTALCYNSQKIIFTVVDGRQPALSVGMTLDELADLMLSLGCTVAMNTDGGGSSVMAVGDGQDAGRLRIVNSPSDGKERGRGNAWVVLQKK